MDTINIEAETGAVKDHLSREITTTTFGVDSSSESKEVSETKTALESKSSDADANVKEDQANGDITSAQMNGEAKVASSEPEIETPTRNVDPSESVLDSQLHKKEKEEDASTRTPDVVENKLQDGDGNEPKQEDDKADNRAIKLPKLADIQQQDSIDSTGYSRIEINSPGRSECPSMPPNESPAYEDVNVDGIKRIETRRPTLPEGHPSLKDQLENKPLVKQKPPVSDKPSKGRKKQSPAGNLTSISENNVSKDSSSGKAPTEPPVYSMVDKSRNSKMNPDVDTDVAAMYGKPNKRKSSGYDKIADDDNPLESLQAQEDAYNATYEDVNVNGVSQRNEPRRPTLPKGHPSLQQTSPSNTLADFNEDPIYQSGAEMTKGPPESSSNDNNTVNSVPQNDDTEMEGPHAKSTTKQPQTSVGATDWITGQSSFDEDPIYQSGTEIGMDIQKDEGSGWVDNDIYSSGVVDG